MERLIFSVMLAALQTALRLKRCSDQPDIRGNTAVSKFSLIAGRNAQPYQLEETKRAIYTKMTIANFFGIPECKLTLEGAAGLRQ
jgi:hypothetical protein